MKVVVDRIETTTGCKNMKTVVDRIETTTFLLSFLFTIRCAEEEEAADEEVEEE